MTKPTKPEWEEKIIELLSGNYACTRVWEAWNYGTMKRGDFIPLEECDELVDEFKSFIAHQISLAEERGYKEGLNLKFPTMYDDAFKQGAEWVIGEIPQGIIVDSRTDKGIIAVSELQNSLHKKLEEKGKV